MNKYFSIETIRLALENLKNVDSKWLIIPLVLAANGVTKSKAVVCNKNKGTGKLIEHFFSGKLIGLEPRGHGLNCNIRPGNPDPRRTNEKLITIDYSDLWGKTYSQSGYGAMQDGLILERKSGPGEFKLANDFEVEFRKRINSSFKFESFLVWLYAFHGFPESVNNWSALLSDFESKHTDGGIPQEYKSVFCLSGSEPWPLEVLSERPSDEELQIAFIPELVSTSIDPSAIVSTRDALQSLIYRNYLGLTQSDTQVIADSIISGLQSCRRIFLYGDPGTGKTELSHLIGASFKEVFGDERVHVVFAPIAESTSTDKLIGYSTLDGSWIDGQINQPSGNPPKKLLYQESSQFDKAQGRRQINIIILDEANRQNIEELLVKFQAALDSESTDPDHDDFRISLDNSGEKRVSPNTFLIMTGNSPREDKGRVVQSRPFKRRQNLLSIENLFRRTLSESTQVFTETIISLWDKVGLALRIETPQRDEFKSELSSIDNSLFIGYSQAILIALDKHSVGISFGLMKKALKTSGMRYALTGNFEHSVDYGLTESLFSVLSAEEPIDGKSIRDTLDELPSECKAKYPFFFETAKILLRTPDDLGRIRPFL